MKYFTLKYLKISRCCFVLLVRLDYSCFRCYLLITFHYFCLLVYFYSRYFGFVSFCRILHQLTPESFSLEKAMFFGIFAILKLQKNKFECLHLVKR